MSWYFSAYLGYQDKEGKIWLLGPYDSNGKLHPVIETSRSFTTDLKDYFYDIPDEAWTPELEDQFSYTDYEGKKVRSEYVGYLPISQLPKGDFIKTGYFLIDEIDRYQKSKTDDWDFDGFYDVLSPEAYIGMVQNEMKFGRPQTKIDEFGEEVTPHSASEYAYFAYPNYNCKEYEAFVLRQMANVLEGYYDEEHSDVVIIKDEG